MRDLSHTHSDLQYSIPFSNLIVNRKHGEENEGKNPTPSFLSVAFYRGSEAKPREIVGCSLILSLPFFRDSAKGGREGGYVR
jgi:hypothetical protein